MSTTARVARSMGVKGSYFSRSFVLRSLTGREPVVRPVAVALWPLGGLSVYCHLPFSS